MKQITIFLLTIAAMAISQAATVAPVQEDKNLVISYDFSRWAESLSTDYSIEMRDFSGRCTKRYWLDIPLYWQASAQYVLKDGNGERYNVDILFYANREDANKYMSLSYFTVAIGGPPKLPDLGDEAFRCHRESSNVVPLWLIFRRSNVCITIRAKRPWMDLLNLAKRMDEEIQHPAGFVKFGDPTARLALAMPSNAVDEDKTLEFGLNLPKDEELIRARASANVGICATVEHQPTVFLYTPRKLGPDEISVDALLKGERVLSTTCAIEVRESADRKARIAALVQRLETEPKMDWKDCCKVLEELLRLVDTREREYGTIFLKYIGPERHSFVRDRAILLIRQVADPRAISPLIDLLKAPIRGNIRDEDEEAIVRRAAVRALGEIADASTIPFLRSIVENTNEYPSVRECTNISIQQIEGTAPRAFNK
ncbi:MAG TPA: HEAT repeat domain-containing protein [bacterium]|nr:HEAT repeat domain-containing protein [bacterium]